MVVKIRYVPVAQALAAGRQPRALLPRPVAGDGTPRDQAASVFHGAAVARVGTYLAAHGPLDAETIDWGECRDGDFVPIPLQAYVADKPIAAAMALGVRAGLSLVGRQASLRLPLELIVVLGEEMHRVDGGARFYAGLAARIE